MIRYDPSKLLRKIAPKRKIKKLISKKLTLKKAALSFVDDIDFLSRKGVQRVALKTIKSYASRIKEDPEIKADLVDDAEQLIQRVQNEIILQISSEIKGNYEGEFYTWLPSDAQEPDPEHQLNYGKTFQIGVGEMPGDRYGCRCGMEIQVPGSSLEL